MKRILLILLTVLCIFASTNVTLAFEWLLYNENTYAPDQQNVYTLNSFYRDVERLKESSIISVQTIGQTVFKRDILLIKLGRGEKKIFVNAGTHSRENANTPIVMQSLFELTNAYNQNLSIEKLDVKTLLSEYTFYIIPLLNPDGYEICLSNWNSQMKTNANGVNLNRNFPTKYWGNPERIKVTSGNLFPGSFPASEPETRAVMSLASEHSFLFCIDIHSRGRGIYYEKGGLSQEDIKGTKTVEELNRLSREVGLLCRRIADYGRLNEKKVVLGQEGSLTDYFFEHGVPTLTYETLPGRSPQPTQFEAIQGEYQRINLPYALLSVAQYFNTQHE